MQAHKEWDFVDTFTEGEQERCTPYCHMCQDVACCCLLASNSTWAACLAQFGNHIVVAPVYIDNEHAIRAATPCQAQCVATCQLCTCIVSDASRIEVLVHCRLHMYIDFVVCVGGDGVILHASYLFKRAIPPVSLYLHFAVGHLITHTQHDCTPLQTCVPIST